MVQKCLWCLLLLKRPYCHQKREKRTGQRHRDPNQREKKYIKFKKSQKKLNIPKIGKQKRRSVWQKWYYYNNNKKCLKKDQDNNGCWKSTSTLRNEKIKTLRLLLNIKGKIKPNVFKKALNVQPSEIM